MGRRDRRMKSRYYSSEGEIIDTASYPDYSGTKYLNWVDEKKRIPVLYRRKEDCCGCYACYSICPKNAIQMVADIEGFVYPVVDLQKCVGCLRCEKVCPIKSADIRTDKQGQ